MRTQRVPQAGDGEELELAKRGPVVGITKNSVITLFSRPTVDESINYILSEVILLIE